MRVFGSGAERLSNESAELGRWWRCGPEVDLADPDPVDSYCKLVRHDDGRGAPRTEVIPRVIAPLPDTRVLDDNGECSLTGGGPSTSGSVAYIERGAEDACVVVEMGGKATVRALASLSRCHA